jgi:hypothetical protein
MSTESIAIAGIIASVVAALSGAALGSYFTYLSGMKLVQKTHANDMELFRIQELNKAALHFKRTVLQSLEGWYNNQYWNDIINIEIITATQKIELAVAEYRWNLPITRKSAFDKQWEDTKDYLQNHVRSGEYFEFSKNPTGDDPRVKFKEHIDRLLSYTDNYK